MDSITRMLCRKYTALTEEEIACIETHESRLPALANAEQADVFIDCASATGRTAIVVGEAKPQTVPSSYSAAILGMIIQWKNEPAVDRSFRLGVATTGVKAVSMPEGQQIVQSVEPIFFQGKVIAVLIYEKQALSVQAVLETETAEWYGADERTLLESLSDGIVLFDEQNRVCGYNTAACRIYHTMGYVSDILGMDLSNIRLDAEADLPREFREVTVCNCVLQYRYVPHSTGCARTALILRDVTTLRQTQQELQMQLLATRELRHRMKNNLQMLSTLLQMRSGQLEDTVSAQFALLDASNRLLALTVTLDGMVQTTDGTVALRQVLERVRTFTQRTLLGTLQEITICVQGDDPAVSPDCATSVALVVGELLQNALKHAFPAGLPGTVTVSIVCKCLLCTVCVTDNGTGFSPTDMPESSLGLGLVRTIVTEKLTGTLEVESGVHGTRATFDFPI